MSVEVTDLVVENALGFKLPASIMKQVRTAVNDFKTAVGRKQRAEARLKAYYQDLNDLRESCERVPKGMKPFHVGPEAEFLEIWTPCIAEDYEMTIKFPQGTTKKDALKIFHNQHQQMYRMIDISNTQSYIERLEASLSYDRFLKAAMSPGDEYTQTMMSLGIPLPPKLHPCSTAAMLSRQQAEKIYVSMLHQMTKDKMEEEKRKERERKQKDKLKADLDVVNRKELFEAAVIQVMTKQKNSMAGKIDERVDYLQSMVHGDDLKSTVDWEKSKAADKPPAKRTERPDLGVKKRRFTKSELAERKMRDQSSSKNWSARSVPDPGKTQSGGKGSSKGTADGKAKGKGRGKGGKQA